MWVCLCVHVHVHPYSYLLHIYLFTYLHIINYVVNNIHFIQRSEKCEIGMQKRKEPVGKDISYHDLGAKINQVCLPIGSIIVLY
jgi:hypothetical protein